ncbi:Protein COFACTOR ASSEMBLY OF COMPLEX C SUBUNIT B CCB3, chloroplastic [Linum grandiflorum]
MSEAAAGFHLASRIGISSNRSSLFNRGVDLKQHQLPKSTKLPIITHKITASASGSGSIRKRSRSLKRLIRISTGEGRWNNRYSRHYSFTFWDLQLEDLVQDDDATVAVDLSVDKHASFGFSVDGTIVISFTRKCSNCSSPYSTKIDTKVNVWVLPSSREKHDKGSIGVPLPVIGGEDDPSVIYVKPGHEADLDSLVKDSIRRSALSLICPDEESVRPHPAAERHNYRHNSICCSSPILSDAHFTTTSAILNPKPDPNFLLTQNTELGPWMVAADIDPATAKLAIAFLGPILSGLSFLFIVRIVMSWYPKLPVDKFPYIVAYAPTEPILAATRRVIQPVGGVDVAPVVWFALISFLNEILVGPQGLLVLISQQVG